ncbi:MAG: GNAT family N-acetyltransferase [Novosphingobium sp.]|nr:GNAT family N-acetyltransferase [Novosphingobium sp.]
MTVQLLTDPAQMRALGSLPATFAASLAEQGTPQFIANASSAMLLARVNGHDLPLTVDDGGHGRSYVASPHSAYVDYARREMDLVGLRHGRRAVGAVLGLTDRLLRAARINRAVHVDNWLLSTNLHGDWQGEGLPQLRAALCERYPDHFLILRTLDAWSCPRLLDAARRDGWIMAPARQIWVTDDLSRDWLPRKDRLNDRRILRRSGLTIEEPEQLSSADCERIAHLYALLYLDKYSPLNPAFTPAFIALLDRTGLTRFRLARRDDGTIMAVAGMIARGGHATCPVVGYDTARPQHEGLYRIACYLASEWTLERGLSLHGSAGAAQFKRARGARGEIEYMAIHARHLSAPRRAAARLLAGVLQAAVVPMMRRQGW